MSPVLLCPKCHNVMNAYERNGVTVDQCVECKGLFLDRGELERLAAAETAYYGQPSSVADVREPVPAPNREPARLRDDDRYRDDRQYHKKKKRKAFLEELLDF